ncbi:MAG: hypothetical protein ACI4MS_00720 [Candidatus Coproplasma sp.]
MKSENKGKFFWAEDEGKIEPYALLQELQPLLSDYFAGEFTVCEEGLIMSFPNGQKFILKAEERE